MSFRRLKDADAWETFKTEFAAAHDLVVTEVSWGNGPPVFPCLVTALPAAGQKRVLCCFVTPDDAKSLLGAEEPTGELAKLKKKVALMADQLYDYTVANSAHWRCFWKRAFGTGFYASHEEYEKAYAESLAWVDQLAEDRKKELSVKNLHNDG